MHKVLSCLYDDVFLIASTWLWMSNSFLTQSSSLSSCFPPPDPPLHLRPDLWISHHPHLSPSPTLPFLHFIFQNCNLRWPAVQGAPECVYADLHFITHSLTAGSLTRSVFQPSLPLAMFFFFFKCAGHIPHHCCLLLSLQLLPCCGRWAELLMACGVQTPVPTAASRQACSIPSRKSAKPNKCQHSQVGLLHWCHTWFITRLSCLKALYLFLILSVDMILHTLKLKYSP